MSAIAGASAHFGLPLSPSELFVESSFFAVTNIHRDLKPCGPYVWDHRPIARNLAAMGLQMTWLHSSFDCMSPEYRKQLLDQIFETDDETVVCMAGLEYQILLHRDHEKFVFTLPWGPEIPTCLCEMSIVDYIAGKHFPRTGWFTLHTCEELSKATRLKNSINTALSYYQLEESVQTEYFFGPVAWDQWAATLASGSYDKHGHWWTSMVWSEARKQAAVYFDEHQSHLDGFGQTIRTNFEDLSSVIAKSAAADTTDTERADCIRQAQVIDRTLFGNLLKCEESLRCSESH